MNRIKSISMLAGALLAAGLFSAPVQAVNPLPETFADTATGTTLASYIVPIGDGRPYVTYANATSDKAGSVLQFYKGVSGAHTVTIATNASQAVIYVPDNTKYATNDILVIRHKTAANAGDSYERVKVSDPSAAGKLTLAASIATAMAVGDEVWKMTKYGSIPVGAATKEITTQGIYNAGSGRPVLIDLDGTSACTINLVTGVFLKTSSVITIAN